MSGDPVELDPSGKYYPIDYNVLQKYVQKPKDYDNYILRNPVGEVYYLYNGKVNTDVKEYSIQVYNGISSASKAKEGKTITVKADDIEGKIFINWTTDISLNIISGSLNSKEFSFKMPAQDVTLTANYENDLYVLATDSDFEKLSDSSAPKGYYYHYKGSAEYVEIPKTINGESVTDTYKMFANTSVKGVRSLNNNITNMTSMFEEAKSKTLDLSQLNTSKVKNMSDMFIDSKIESLNLSNFNTRNVTNMYGMFDYCFAKTINLSSFNTSKVTNMANMFSHCEAKSLDLSSFDTSNVTNMSYMFISCAATTGYARTQADADRFNNNAITQIPKTLKFVVK